MPETARFTVLTFDKPAPQPPEPCSGGYLCSCTKCEAELAERLARGPRAHTNASPFKRAA